MVGMNINTATLKIKDFIEANVTDPLSKRTSGWVYTDGARIDLDKTGFPKVLIEQIEEPSIKPPLAIGNNSTENTDEIFIEIKTLMGSEYLDNLDDTKYKAIEFAALMGQKIEDAIKLNKQYFIDQGFLHVIMTQSMFRTDPDRNPTYRVGIEMKYISSPN